MRTALLLIAGVTCAALTANAQRDPWLWPFEATSIWNMPIGSDAVYVDANLEPAARVGVDIQHLLRLDADDPLTPVYKSYSFGEGRCSSSDPLDLAFNVPSDWIVPDAGNSPYGGTPNSNFAFLLPDGETLFENSRISRCSVGGPIYMPDWLQYPANRNYSDIAGDGLTDNGGQGASAMSSLGGTLRKGELTGDAPIRHAIKINPDANKYLYYSESVPGYRWPAKRADGYAGDPDSDNRYMGSDPKLVMGSLLAIPPDVTAESLDLTTVPGRKLFFTLKYYGAYFTEDAAWDVWDLIVERDAELEFESVYGFSMDGEIWKSEINKLVQALHIVDNNSPSSIGGGGTPLQPLACELGEVGSGIKCDSEGAQVAYNGPHAIPGTIECEYYDNGGEGVAFNEVDGNKNGDASFRPSDGVDVPNKSNAGNGKAVGWTNPGEWLEYTIADVASGTYDIVLTYASGSGSPGDLQVELDGNVIGTFADIAFTGADWNTFTTTTIPDVSVAGGSDRVLRLYQVGAGYDLDQIEFVATGGGPAPDADVDTPIEAELFDAQQGIQVVGESKVGYVNDGDWIRFDDMQLEGADGFTAEVSSGGIGGTVEIRSGSPTGGLLGSITVDEINGWNSFYARTTSISGATSGMTIYLVFTGGDGFLLDIDSFSFTSGGTLENPRTTRASRSRRLLTATN
jgi:hypothetical protein